MRAATRNEILLLALGVGVVAVFARRLPDTLELGVLVAAAALTLLVQGGVRDVVSLVRQRRRPASAGDPPHEVAHCLCLESTIGLGGVFIGVALTAFLATGPRVTLPPAGWPLGLAVIGTAGLAMRDLVIEWKPRVRFRRIQDHGAIVVRFR